MVEWVSNVINYAHSVMYMYNVLLTPRIVETFFKKYCKATLVHGFLFMRDNPWLEDKFVLHKV